MTLIKLIRVHDWQPTTERGKHMLDRNDPTSYDDMTTAKFQETFKPTESNVNHRYENEATNLRRENLPLLL